MMTFICWILFCILVGTIASNKCDRNFWAWFFISVFFSPLVGGLILLICSLGKKN